MVITSRDELEKWLDQNYWFEDGFISRIEDDSSNLRIWVGYQVEGSWGAGEPRRLREFEIRPLGVTKWTYVPGEKFEPSYDWCIPEIEMTETGVGLVFDTYAYSIVLELQCGSIEIGEPCDIEATTKPWVSNTDVCIVASRSGIPEPAYWIKVLQERGQNACFRYYCSEGLSIDRVPPADYLGYYLQLPERIAETNEGVFFSNLKHAGSRMSLGIEIKEESARPIWNALLLVLADWPLEELRSGNVALVKDEAKRFLATGELPERLAKLMKHEEE